ncbi:MAG: putative PEP-binding protein, partial [Alphaproteobacteria bacterium]
FNPMLGHRGVRLAITYPEIYAMQARAIFGAAVDAIRSGADAPLVEVMIPLVATRRELDLMRDLVAKEHAATREATGIDVAYQLGTMIELPRAALRAGEIAGTAEFFSFGTNDLTQTTFGLSRDDSSSFLDAYEAAKILSVDPFVSLDRDGVGELVRIAAERGRATRGDLKLGICGEHGGDPASIRFCAETGLDYVSCSPYRVPIARLAAAQAALASGAARAPAAKPAPSRGSAASGAARNRSVLLASGRRPAAGRVSVGKASVRPVAVKVPGRRAAKPAPAKPAAAKASAPKRSAPRKPAPAKGKPASKGVARKPAPSRPRGGGKPRRGR